MVGSIGLAVLSLAGEGAARTQPTAQQKTDAQAHYREGMKLFKLGRFPDAAKEFERAYELDPAPVHLFNIAQSHWKNRDYTQAKSFYKRYIVELPNGEKRPVAEDRIAEIDKILAGQRAIEPGETAPKAVAPHPVRADEPTVGSLPPVVGPDAGGRAGDDVGDAAHGIAAAREGSARFRASASAGIAFPALAGSSTFQAPLLFSANLAAAYIVRASPPLLQIGALAGYTPVPYRTVGSGAKAGSSLLGLFATVGLEVPLGAAFVLTPAAGVGAVWWIGLERDNPFTSQGQGADGPIPMPSARVSLAAVWALTAHSFVGLMPAFTFSKTTGDALRETVSSFSRLDLNATFGVRF